MRQAQPLKTEGAGPDGAPNIVMVMTDQHAARVMGCAGDEFARTPVLDKLAKQGTRFENCYCPSPLCVPSRMAFLTGLEPHESGVLSNDDYLPSDVPTIAHSLAGAGYDCHLVGRMHFYGPDQLHGFTNRPIGDIGASFPGGSPPDIGPLTKGRGNRGPELEFSGAGETSYQAYDHAVMKEAEATLAHLQRQRAETGRPFFLLISLFCPHPPYIARRADYDAFDGRLPGPMVSRPDSDHPAIAAWRDAGRTDGVSPIAVAASRAAYYGLVQMVDRLCQGIFDMTEDCKNTVTIYTSDHGECLGERGLWWKSVMYDESAKVPLIIRGTAFEPGKQDRRIVSLFDLSATMLSLGDASPLPGHNGQDLRRQETWPDEVISSYYGGLMNIKLADLRHRMIRKSQYKLMWFDGYRPQLFDLDKDPQELTDLSGDTDHLDILSDLSEQLLRGWDPALIAQLQALKGQRSALIRQWVRVTQPAEPYRWIDPRIDRNAYE
ncbi:MAG: sulfatase-like hydrolase/transferase [Stappiaceae bacterium]